MTYEIFHSHLPLVHTATTNEPDNPAPVPAAPDPLRPSYHAGSGGHPMALKLQVYRHLLAHTCTLLYPWNLYTARNMIKIRQDASLARLAGYFVINESIKRLRRFIQTSAAFLCFHLIVNCCNICFSRRITPYLQAHDNSGFTSQTPPRNPS